MKPELTLRAHDEGAVHSFIDTTNVGKPKMGATARGRDWHAIRQAIFKGVEGAERETMCYKYVEVAQRSHLQKKNTLEKTRKPRRCCL